MSHATDANAKFWIEYYKDVAARSPAWLDYSNAAFQAQTFAFVLESSGTIAERSCLDLGCGRGQLTSLFKIMGAREVVGVDGGISAIDWVATSPGAEIRWLCRDLNDPRTYQSLAPADLVSIVEVLQNLPAEIISHIWSVVAPGGRLVGTVPNAECPIVQRTAARFDGRWVPLAPNHLLDSLKALEGLAGCAVRPLAINSDQRISPYAAGPWTTSPDWPDLPNRIQFIALKSEV